MNTILLVGLLAIANPPTQSHSNQPETVFATQAKMVFRENTTSVDVRIQKPVGKGASLSLTHREGGLVHHETIGRRQANSLLRLHLHELPDGVYDLVVTDHKYRTVLRQEVKLKTGTSASTYRELAVNVP